MAAESTVRAPGYSPRLSSRATPANVRVGAHFRKKPPRDLLSRFFRPRHRHVTKTNGTLGFGLGFWTHKISIASP